MALAGLVLLSSPQFWTATVLPYRPAGLPGFRDLPLLILAVEHGADAVRVLGPQLHSGKHKVTPRPARSPAPGPSPRSAPVPRLLPAVPAAPGAGGGASAARGSPAGGCSWPAPAPRCRAPAATPVTSRPRVTSVPSNSRREIPLPAHRPFPWDAGDGRCRCQVHVHSGAAVHGPPLRRHPAQAASQLWPPKHLVGFSKVHPIPVSSVIRRLTFMFCYIFWSFRNFRYEGRESLKLFSSDFWCLSRFLLCTVWECIESIFHADFLRNIQNAVKNKDRKK